MAALDQNVYNVATLVGTLLSLIGVVITLAQIRKTLTAATAAERAAAATQSVITRNVFLTDVSACITGIEELKVLIRASRFEAALLRVTDLTTALIRLQHLPDGSDGREPFDFRDTLTQLAILRELLEQKAHDSSSEIDAVQANSVLSKVSDGLNHWVGSAKYIVREAKT